MWEILTPKAMKKFFWDTPLQAKLIGVYNKKTKKVMETVNVVIDESLESSSKKFSEEIPKEILPPEPKDVQEIVDLEPASPSTLSTSSVVEELVDILFHLILNPMKRKDLSQETN